MNKSDVLQSWGLILRGFTPTLSIEITRECPLRCPGCYAFGDDHLGGDVTLREVSDHKGPALVEGVLALVARYRPLHLSIVGGEPLVRYRELNELLPTLTARGIHVQVVTSAVRPIPLEWAALERLNISVSIDGLQPEHDERRKPATYDRILKHIAGHQVTVHCTITRQQVAAPGYLRRFVTFWSDQPAAKRIWMSLYTPQIGEQSPERLTPDERRRAADELLALREEFPKLDMPKGLIEAYLETPRSPSECIFSRVTTSISADLKRMITPCQFGGNPDCSNCGCIASAGLAAVGRHRLPGGVRVGSVFEASLRIGAAARWLRGQSAGDGPPMPPMEPRVAPQ